MSDFERMFRKSSGKPIQYKGHTLVLVDLFPTKGCQRFRLKFQSTDSEWKQGVLLRANGLVVGNVVADRMVLWEDTAPSTVNFSLQCAEAHIEVRNVWDTGKGVVESWHNGAAMIVDPIPNGHRYFCNDGHPDDDLNDLIFRIERIG